MARRPWPPTGLTSATWKQVPAEMVRLDDLVPTQNGVLLKALLEPSEPVGGDEYAHVVRWRGKLYLEDGHTRWARAKLRGHKWIPARIFTIEE